MTSAADADAEPKVVNYPIVNYPIVQYPVVQSPSRTISQSYNLKVRRWLVGGALIRHGDGLILVCNRRRDNSVEWTPPGGVIDHGETLLDGLTREVFEETGLVVSAWSDRCYTVTVEAPDMGWEMTVEAWETDQVTGEVRIADPDGIVEEVRHSSAVDALGLMTASPLWVRLPVSAWLSGEIEAHYRFALSGTDRAKAKVERL